MAVCKDCMPVFYGADELPANVWQPHMLVLKHVALCPLHAATPKLLEACKRALPYVADHCGMTLDEGPGDRMAYDFMESVIAEAEAQS